MFKKVLMGVGALLALVLVVGGGFFGAQVHAFQSSMDHVYDIPIPSATRSTDPAVIERGHHLATSIAGCALTDCHGADMGGGRTINAGPIGSFAAPNATLVALAYSDGELVRLIRHGVRRDGRSLRMMPVQDFNWLPDEDVLAIVSWLRTLPAVTRAGGEFRLGVLGEFLDRREMIIMDVARHVDHTTSDHAPAPSPTAAYGSYIGRLCTGCHGATLSGGPIPGAPASMAVPLNLTPHATGLAGWSYEDFVRVATTAARRDGRRLDPMMPTQALVGMNDTERRALWAYLQSLPPRPFGGR